MTLVARPIHTNDLALRLMAVAFGWQPGASCFSYGRQQLAKVVQVVKH